MNISDLGDASALHPHPVLDLNDLLIDHPAASFVFRVGSKLAIVDRAAFPEEDCIVIVETATGFVVESYHRQVIFGVITYLIKRTT